MEARHEDTDIGTVKHSVSGIEGTDAEFMSTNFCYLFGPLERHGLRCAMVDSVVRLVKNRRTQQQCE